MEAPGGVPAEGRDDLQHGAQGVAQGAAASTELTAARAELLVDPAVSRVKFARDVEQCRRLGGELRRRGWWILEAEFPTVLAAFVAPQLRPRPVMFGARIDFENYDLWAPSVRIVDPFTGKPLLSREVPPHLAFARRVEGVGEVQVPGLGLVQGYGEQPLLVAHGPDELPFLCLPGVREYHEHPAHTGDDWLLRRDRGEGTLYFLLEKLARYGLEPVQQYQFGLQIVGFARGEAPE